MPWQNGATESSNGQDRDERLLLEWFRLRAEAKVVIWTLRRHFDEVRPLRATNIERALRSWRD